MIRIVWSGQELACTTTVWSGTDTQASRELTFEVPTNNFDKDFKNAKIKLADIVTMYNDYDPIFVGVVTSRDKTAEAGVTTYTARDFMHYLLRSSGSYKFKNKTAEKISKKLCKDIGISVGSLAKTKINIPKLIYIEEPFYDMIVNAYYNASKVSGTKYMPCMDGKKFCVIEKGADCGVIIEQGSNLISANYTDTSDNMINQVVIFSDKGKKLGKVKTDKVEKYGVYQQAYTKEDGKNAKKVAKNMMVGITKEASVEAIGDISCIAGKAVTIHDKSTGLEGKFYVTSDTHTFENGTHTMQLELAWMNTQEEGATYEEETKKELKNSEKCFYLANSSIYHSSKNCPLCKGKSKQLKKSTVAEMKKIRITSGANKGKRKYKPCSKCWEV